jgi:hypothetical protein
MSKILTETTRMELRQVLGVNVANRLLEAIESSSHLEIGAIAGDVNFLKVQCEKFQASVNALVDSHIKLQRQLDVLRADVNAMRDPPPLEPPPELPVDLTGSLQPDPPPAE